MSSRSVLRCDVTTGDWVLFAPARAQRPHRPAPPPAPSPPPGRCPFCPGNEALTPPEVLRLDDGAGGWSVRVVPNLYPALDPSLTPARHDQGPVFRALEGCGVHEVVIESTEHARPLSQQPLEQAERILQVLHRRFCALKADPRLQAIVLFKNQGERAGTSLTHPHWQLIATPIVPRLLRLEQAVARDYFNRTSRSLYGVVLDEELAAGTRVLSANEDFVAVLPWASQVPYQVRILPREQRSSFAGVDPDRLRPLARMLQGVLGRLERVLAAPDFNLTLGTAPLADEDNGYYRWHLDVLPRLATPAGFELGSGMAINPVLPEEAASALREVD